MKALFRNKFPFVELPNDQLTTEQLSIKNQYDQAYALANQINEINLVDEIIVSPIPKKEKADRLRKVRNDAERTGGEPDGGRSDNGNSENLLPE